MSDTAHKMQLVFWPLLRLELIFLAAYGSLLWLIMQAFPAFDPPEGLWRWGLPAMAAQEAIMQTPKPRWGFWLCNISLQRQCKNKK